MPPTPPPEGRRRRAVPSWYYIAGAAGVAGVFFLYNNNKKKNAAALAAAGGQGVNATPAVTPAVTYTPGADLSSLLSYLTAQGNTSQSGVVSTPLTTSTSGITPPGTPQGPTSVAGNGDAGNQNLYVVGTITQPGTFTGYNVTGGAPVFANVNGTWKIGLPGSAIPVGSQLATPSYANINTGAGQVTERI